MRVSSFLVASAAIAMAAASVPANAVTFVAGTPQSLSVSYDGFGGEPAQVLSGLSATLALDFLGTENSGATYKFAYDLSNTSSVTTQLTVFGFNINPAASGADTGSGDTFDNWVTGTSNIPNLGNVNFCLKDGGNENCTSGQGNSGLAAGTSASGTFTVSFASAPAQISFTDLFVRYQGIEGLGDVNSAIGRGSVTAVPEPATWAMMIGGFGLVGGAMRRRAAKVAFA